MPEPTQEQIEAALNAFNHSMQKGQNRRQAITAAITAAAALAPDKRREE